MKDYRPGRWGLCFIFSCEGSVFPRAFTVALPNAILAVAMWYFWKKFAGKEIHVDTLHKDTNSVSTGQIWSAFNFVVSFVVSFRAQQAYSRWWEGGTLLQQARGEWFNAYSSVIAFCSHDNNVRDKVAKFQHSMARMVSMLHASALMSIVTDDSLDFEIIDVSGIGYMHVEYLRTQPDKCEIIMQWIQRLIVENTYNGVVTIAPPILSRVFQELSRGIVNIHNVRKITEFQFPFPLAQMMMSLLLAHWFLTPVVTSLLVSSPIWAFGLAFFPTFGLWGINFIASEIEQPFGTDPNDMPLHFMQANLNTSVLALLDVEAQNPPDFDSTQARMQEIFPEPSKTGKRQDPLEDMRSVRWVSICDPTLHRRLAHHSWGETLPFHGADLAMTQTKMTHMESDASVVAVTDELGGCRHTRSEPVREAVVGRASLSSQKRNYGGDSSATSQKQNYRKVRSEPRRTRIPCNIFRRREREGAAKYQNEGNAGDESSATNTKFLRQEAMERRRQWKSKAPVTDRTLKTEAVEASCGLPGELT